MREYNRFRIHSFKCECNIAKEVKITRVYTRRGKQRTDIVYGERTTEPNIIIIPLSLIGELWDNAPYGYNGEIKSGKYYINDEQVVFDDIHSVYNGEGYAVVHKVIEK